MGTIGDPSVFDIISTTVDVATSDIVGAGTIGGAPVEVTAQ